MNQEDKRINFKAGPELHSEVKKRAAARGVSIKTWVTRAIIEQIKKEQKYEKVQNEND